MRACVRACVRARACARVRACARASVFVFPIKQPFSSPVHFCSNFVLRGGFRVNILSSGVVRNPAAGGLRMGKYEKTRLHRLRQSTENTKSSRYTRTAEVGRYMRKHGRTSPLEN